MWKPALEKLEKLKPKKNQLPNQTNVLNIYVERRSWGCVFLSKGYLRLTYNATDLIELLSDISLHPPEQVVFVMT
jgi:hypothetical protein